MRAWQPTPGFWPGEFYGLYSPWSHKELDTTEQLSEKNAFDVHPCCYMCHWSIPFCCWVIFYWVDIKCLGCSFIREGKFESYLFIDFPPYIWITRCLSACLYFFLLLLLWLTGNLKIIQCGNSRNEILPFPESAIVAIFSISRDFWINSVNSVFFLVCDHWYHYSVSFTLAWIMIEQILP